VDAVMPDTGSPVALVKVADEGVPSAPPNIKTSAPASAVSCQCAPVVGVLCSATNVAEFPALTVSRTVAFDDWTVTDPVEALMTVNRLPASTLVVASRTVCVVLPVKI
jgi:hypothetical protein